MNENELKKEAKELLGVVVLIVLVFTFCLGYIFGHNNGYDKGAIELYDKNASVDILSDGSKVVTRLLPNKNK